jgi:hypothetical protein
MLKNLVAMATNRLKYGKFNNICDNSKHTGNIFMNLLKGADGNVEIMHVKLSMTIRSIFRVVLLTQCRRPGPDF